MNPIKKQIPVIQPKQYSLSCCVVIKNEEKFIVDCLNRLYWLADEIIIVDTGSTDQTHQIVEDWIKKYGVSDRTKFEKVGDKFHDSDGDFDFGAAKTYSFSLATKSYVMWIDGADLVEKPKDFRKIFKEVTAKNHPLAFIVKTQVSEKSSFPRLRITPREGSKMIGRVHEVMYKNPKWKRCTLMSVIKNRLNTPSSERNLRILLKDWKLNPNKRNAFYLGNTYYTLKDYENALEWFKCRAYKFHNDQFKEETFKALELATKITLSLCRSGKDSIENLLKLSNDMIKFNSSRYEGYYYKAKYFMEKSNWEGALKYLNMYEQCRVPKKTILWIDSHIYVTKVYLMDIEKCETAIKYKNVLQPDEILETSQFRYPTSGFHRSSSNYVVGNAQYQ